MKIACLAALFASAASASAERGLRLSAPDDDTLATPQENLEEREKLFAITCRCYDHIEPGIKFETKACLGHSINGQCSDWMLGPGTWSSITNTLVTKDERNHCGRSCQNVSCWCRAADGWKDVQRNLEAKSTYRFYRGYQDYDEWSETLTAYGDDKEFGLIGKIYHNTRFLKAARPQPLWP